MRKLFVPLLGLLMACACTQKNGEGTPEAQQQTPDTIVFNFNKDHINSNLKVVAPLPQIATAVGEWLDEELDGCYPGDANDMQSLVDFYGNYQVDILRNILIENGNPDPETEVAFEATVEKAFETDKIVTYTLSTYYDFGGVHPTSAETGATFRKSDGRRLGWEILRNSYQSHLESAITESLKNYFNADSDEELHGSLFNTDEYAPIPLPKTPPFFLENGVCFIYQQYEITAYAYGMPNDTIPYDTIKPMMTEWAKRLTP